MPGYIQSLLVFLSFRLTVAAVTHIAHSIHSLWHRVAQWNYVTHLKESRTNVRDWQSILGKGVNTWGVTWGVGSVEWGKKPAKHFRCHCTAFRLSCSQQPKHNTQEETSFRFRTHTHTRSHPGPAESFPLILLPLSHSAHVSAELLVSLKLESLALAHADGKISDCDSVAVHF